jgi:hypothetical protein
MATEDRDPTTPVILTVASLLALNTIAQVFHANITQIEMDFATSMVLSERLVEIPGRFSPLEAIEKPEPMVLPELRTSTCRQRSGNVQA